MSYSPSVSSLLLLLGVAISGVAHAQPVVLGPLPAGANQGGLSGDGRFVVAAAVDPPAVGVTPYRWSEAGGFEFLSSETGVAMDASFDGTAVVGRRTVIFDPPCYQKNEAAIWTSSGVVGLGWLANEACPDSYGWAVSNDATVVAGSSYFGPGFGVPRAFRWTEVGGMELLDLLPGDVYGDALGVSADGSTIVGASAVHPVQWTEGGVAALVPIAGYESQGKAVAASADGSVVVGTGYASSGGGGLVGAATRWVDGVAENLGDLPGNSISAEATGVSADGSVVVGHSSASGGTGDRASKAFYWTAESGMRALTNVLAQDFGMDVSGLLLEQSVAVSNDGRTVLVRDGHGTHNDLLLVRLPAIPGRPACNNAADDDGDGLTDFPADPGCQSASSTIENPKCDDDLDNDGDGGMDWDGGTLGLTPDPQCVATPWRGKESPSGCGLGAEVVLGLAAIDAIRRRAKR